MKCKKGDYVRIVKDNGNHISDYRIGLVCEITYIGDNGYNKGYEILDRKNKKWYWCEEKAEELKLIEKTEYMESLIEEYQKEIEEIENELKNGELKRRNKI